MDGGARPQHGPCSAALSWGGPRSLTPRREHQLQSQHSPTHSQVHCKKRPLPPGMASLWPLREETTTPITLAGRSPLPQPQFLRPSPLEEQTPLLTLQREVTA